MGAKPNLSEQMKNKPGLKGFSLWAIGVGLVISGESFGWNNGWRLVGIPGFFVSFVLVSFVYLGLSHCKIQLAALYPEASGPQDYIQKKLPLDFANFVGFATLVEFLFASPAIANTIGEYIHFLFPDSLSSKTISLLFLFLFCGLNVIDISISIGVTLFLTFLAIGELCLYFLAVGTHFSIENILANSNFFIFPDFWDSGKLWILSFPFAIWMFLGIEGISLLKADIEKDRFHSHIKSGYFSSFLTLFILAALVLILSGGSNVWKSSDWERMVSPDNGHPLPMVLEITRGKSDPLVQLFTFLGLFGLIASLQGILLAAMQQTQVLFQNRVHRVYTAIFVACFGAVAIFSQTTSFLIEISVFGALCMYGSVAFVLWREKKSQGIASFVIGFSILTLSVLGWEYPIFFLSFVFLGLLFSLWSRWKKN